MLWPVPLTTVVVETQQRFPLVSLCDLYVAVRNKKKPFSLATETQERVLFALLSRYRIFRSASKSINVLRSSCKVPDIFLSDFNQIWEFFSRFL